MYRLKSLVYRVTCPSGLEVTYNQLISALREQKVAILHEDRDKGRIIVSCLSAFFNVILWRCWSDKLVIEVTEKDEHRAEVCFYAVPSLLRFKVGKDETLIDLHDLVRHITGELRWVP